MKVAIRENDETAVLGTGILARLFLADERILVLGLGFQYQQRSAPGIEQKEIDEAALRTTKIIPKRIQIAGRDGNGRFEADVGGCAILREKTPARRFQQLVDFDSGG